MEVDPADSAPARKMPFPALHSFSVVTDCQAMIHAQIRAFHFLKFNKQVPEALLNECGQATYR